MWNSLEIVKLLVSAAVPLSVAGLGFWFTALVKRLDAAQWRNQKLVEKRIEVIDALAPDLNDIYCYFSWVGTWKSLSPLDVLERKRRLDRTIHVNHPFLSNASRHAYDDFHNALFATYAGPGLDARLKTSMTSQDGDRTTAYAGAWESSWDSMFVAPDAGRDEIRRLYSALRVQLGCEIGACPTNFAVHR